MKKMLIIVTLLVISAVFMLFKENININEDVYVVSYSETKEKDSINKEISENKEENRDLYNVTNNNEITIYISGEVLNPGIVTIEKDKRLYDAIEVLGGTTVDADLNRINMAMKLDDEKHYIIPKIGEDLTDDTIEDESLDTVIDDKKSNKININNATIEELDKLPGVGEATANKIVRYREENNKFNTIEEIKNVNGIGDKKYEELKDMICVE